MGTKSRLPSPESLGEEIRTIYRSDPSKADGLINAWAEERLKELSAPDRLVLLEKVADRFKTSGTRGERLPQQEEFLRLFSLLLGKPISVDDLSSTEPLERLAHSLNTVFDTLNQIVSGIRTTLLGRTVEMETIRQIIGSDLSGQGESGTLQSYLDQIQNSFLVAHRSFQQAVQVKVRQVLAEMDPDRMEAEASVGLRFGALRKAELFEIYKEKFLKLKGYFESGRFMEELLREFEKSCQKLYQADLRREK
jgi:hypothetical protein